MLRRRRSECTALSRHLSTFSGTRSAAAKVWTGPRRILVSWSDAAAEGRADCPGSGPHWTAIFSAAAADFRSTRALLHRLALRSTAWHARSYMCSMSRSLASRPSIEHVQCAWHEVRLDLRGAGEAHIACTARDHAAETSHDGRHDDTDESRRL